MNVEPMDLSKFGQLKEFTYDSSVPNGPVNLHFHSGVHIQLPVMAFDALRIHVLQGGRPTPGPIHYLHEHSEIFRASYLAEQREFLRTHNSDFALGEGI